MRDALDRALGGRIKDYAGTLATGKTYRFHTQRLTANDPLVYTGLLLGLGQPVDREISAWDEMFLPLALRDHIRNVTVRGARWNSGARRAIRANAIRIHRNASASRRPLSGCPRTLPSG